MASDGRQGTGPDIERGPQDTRDPSRVAMVVVGIGAVILVVMLVLASASVPDRVLDEGETLLESGRHELSVGPVEVDAELTGGDWVLRQRCDRWTQLSDATDDASTLHVVWLDAVPEPSTVGDVELIPPPEDLAAWWRDTLHLDVTRLGEVEVDGRTATRLRLEPTDQARREDGLVACGDLGGVAATGLLGPAARFDQQVAHLDVDGTTLLLIAAAYVGGDPDRLDAALEDLLATASISAPGATSSGSDG